MTFKRIIMRTAAASGILLAGTALVPASFLISAFPAANAAQVETSISVNFSFGSFYDNLQPYGSWVSFEDQYVFVPEDVSSTWRPYTLGHWSYTDRYGWLWVSDEAFGWATYHYGRWGYAREIGWYWVPGRRWAPAWVAWSHGRDEIAWAPLPPRRGTDVDISIVIGDVPDYYWQAVPTSFFLSINLYDHVIRDRDHVRTIIQQNPPQTVRIENNIVVNNVIQVNEIEKATNAKVPVLVEKSVNTPDAVGKVDGNTVAIFNPVVAADTTAKPKKALKVEEVVTERKTKGIEPQDVPADETSATAPAADKKGKPVVPAEPAAPKAQLPVKDKAKTDTLVVKPQTDKGKAKTDAPVVKPPADTATPKTEVPLKKKKKDAGASEQKDIEQDVTPPADAKTPPADAQKAAEPVKKDEKAKVKDKKGKIKCDPEVEICPPVQ